MSHASSETNRKGRSTRAFSLLELLISIAVIFILVSTALVGLRAARKGAERTVSLNALRQMMTAYSNYASEHSGRLLPGYIAPTMIGTGANQLDIKAKLKSGYKLNAADTASYVWRLAPYVDYKWEVFMADYGSDSLNSRLASEYGTGDGVGGEAYGPGTADTDQIGIARHPSYGLNSIFVGGDSLHGPSSVVNTNPWTGTNHKAITRLSQPKNPSKLIVFAPTQAATQPTDLGVDVVLGYPELRPPFTQFAVNTGAPTTNTRQWYMEGNQGPNQNKIVPDANFTSPGGLPIDRMGDGRIAVGHLDASTTIFEIYHLGPSEPANPNAVNATQWDASIVRSY